MSTEMHNITVRIMNRELKIQCPKEKIKELQESATYLEEKMSDLVSSGQPFSMEKVAIVTALNVVRDLMTLKRQDKTYLQAVTHRLRELKDKIEQEVVGC